MRQYPKPLADIERRKKGGKARDEIKVGEEVVKEFWQPDLFCSESAGLAADPLCFR